MTLVGVVLLLTAAEGLLFSAEVPKKKKQTRIVTIWFLDIFLTCRISIKGPEITE